VAENALTRLCAELAVEPVRLDFLGEFTDEELAILTAAITRTAQRQHDVLTEALERVVAVAPRMLRPQITKILFPGGHDD